MTQTVLEIFSHFIDQPVTQVEICEIGHINSTWFVTAADGKKYVLQKINKNIFKQPEVVMNNIVAVTDFIREILRANGGDVERGALNALISDSGEHYLIDEDGEYWRLYDFITDATCYLSADSTELFCKVGYAFGHFQSQLADFDASVLGETIPNFHNTAIRYQTFLRAVEADVCGRAASVAEDIRFVTERAEKCSFIVDRIATGELPLRVTHNDTKLNNIMMDNTTGEGICILDLDTIMPGSVLYDFGDSIRFGASSAAEDETDLDKVFIREDMFRAYTEGFLKGLGGSLSEAEIKALPMGAYVITLETGIRFLTDYLEGDTYFRIHREGHNLDRARNQFKLVADMEAKMEKLNAIVAEFVKS
ncbi:MAG: aminoglycoside phosphotransferase family protein [Clostridia bacterium]|nr:aminoglycoside phosphotransferase family protein [Clostridia bacterium]